ncbi:MAG: tetratricopeptide repeat protein [Xanthomonadales bacterium]|nr:tetratricopeptide repeat protein [Xanthomonadales bacterium]
MSIFNELKRRNVFKVAAAYIIVGWLIMQVGDTLAPALRLPEWINSALAFFLILGFPLAIFFAWAFEMTPEGLKKQKDIDRGRSITHLTGQKLNNIIIGLLILAVGYFAFDKFVLDPQRDAELVSQVQQQATAAPPQADGTDENSIAVLPFVNMSEDAANEYFSDGISEEILNALAQVSDLKVAGRTSSFAFKGKDQDLRVIGEALGVKHILEGSVRKAGNRVRITAQLIQADDGFHLWSETFDRELDDIFAIQDEIAQTILEEMRFQLIGEETRLQASTKTDVESYELYLRARQLIHQRTLGSLNLASELLREVIAADPEYAPAHAQLGIVTLLTSELHYGTSSADDARAQALPLLEKSVEIDSELAEGWAGLGLYHLNIAGKMDEAIGHLRRSLALNPSQIDANNWLQSTLSARGEIDAATQVLERINDRDPLYGPAIFNLAVRYVLSNRLEASQALIERSERYMSNDIAVERAKGLHYLLSYQTVPGYRVARAVFEQDPSDPGARITFSIAQMEAHEDEWAAEQGLGWAKCVCLARLKRVEEGRMYCRELAELGGEQVVHEYFEFLVNNGRERELLQYVADRWSDLDAFERDHPNLDGFAWRTMGHIALAHRQVGNESKYADALQRYRTKLDIQRANGADSILMELAEAYYFALANDWDSALTHLERASQMGYALSLDTSSYWEIYQALDGDPRFEALKQDGHRRINEAREELGLEPLET